jgi:hypothetical protein
VLSHSASRSDGCIFPDSFGSVTVYRNIARTGKLRYLSADVGEIEEVTDYCSVVARSYLREFSMAFSQPHQALQPCERFLERAVLYLLLAIVAAVHGGRVTGPSMQIVK